MGPSSSGLMPCRHFSCCRFLRCRVWRRSMALITCDPTVAKRNLGGAWFFYCLFVAGMILVLLARTTVLFLVAWEVMSVAAFALVTFEHEKEEVRRAGWIYLIAAHIGVAALLAAFLLLGSQAGSLDFAAFEHLDTLTPSSANLVFVLALIGFGTKAGLVPLHVWLPEAHPAAPSHVSALMSGVMIKMGIYGLLRFASFLGEPAAWWGVCLAVLGLFSGLVGISLAVSQRDFKRALAYSSIENIGLIVFSLGLGLWGMSEHQTSIAVLGLTAALLHVWNHSAMKGLLFLAAGSVLHGTGTKDFERLGGLMTAAPVDEHRHSGRKCRDFGVAAVERICQRMADVSGPAEVRANRDWTEWISLAVEREHSGYHRYTGCHYVRTYRGSGAVGYAS